MILLRVPHPFRQKRVGDGPIERYSLTNPFGPILRCAKNGAPAEKATQESS